MILYIIIYYIFKILNKKYFNNTLYNNKEILNFFLLLLILIFSFLWYIQFTDTANNIIAFSKDVYTNLDGIFDSNNKATGASFIEQFSLKNNIKTEINLNDFIINKTISYSDANINSNFYENHISYNINTKYETILPNKFNYKFSSNLFLLIDLIKKIIKILIIIGFIYLLYNYIFNKYGDENIIIILLISFIGLITMLILPFASTSYNLERLYQQLLPIFIIPLIIGLFYLIKITYKKLNIIYVYTIIILIIFIFNSGFIVQIIGGSYPQPNLNNIGIDIDKYYVFISELYAIEWLENNNNNKNKVFASRYSKHKINYLSNITYINQYVFPSIIERDAYVYAGNTNFNSEKSYILISGKLIIYTFPKEFIINNKNNVYSNGKGFIFY